MYASVHDHDHSLTQPLQWLLPCVPEAAHCWAVAWRVLAGIWVVSVLLGHSRRLVPHGALGIEQQEPDLLSSTQRKTSAFHLFSEVITALCPPGRGGQLLRHWAQVAGLAFRRSCRTGRLVALIILAFAAFGCPTTW